MSEQTKRKIRNLLIVALAFASSIRAIGLLKSDNKNKGTSQGELGDSTTTIKLRTSAVIDVTIGIAVC